MERVNQGLHSFTRYPHDRMSRAFSPSRRASPVSSRNAPLSKRLTLKTFRSQNVPSQNVPFLKQNVPVGQNVPKLKRTNVNELM